MRDRRAQVATRFGELDDARLWVVVGAVAGAGKEIRQRFQAQGLETLAVAMSYDPPAYVRQFAQTRQLPFRVTIDQDGSLAKAFGDVQLTPTTLVINREGKVVKRYVGEPDFKALHALLGQLLAEPAR